MWRVECAEAMLLWVLSVWETHAPQYIYGASYSDGAFNALVGALPLQIGVGVSIAVSFTFSQSFFLPLRFCLLCAYANFPFKRAIRDS